LLVREIERAMGGRSPAAFARDAGLTRQALSLLLQGRSAPTGRTLAALQRAGVRLSPQVIASLAA
jgi:DNA-binding phage protein